MKRETPRQECLRRIAEVGADWQENTPDGGLDADTWTPPGIVWQATGTHGLVISYGTDRPAAWRDLLEDLRAGTMPCVDPDCETCQEGP